MPALLLFADLPFVCTVCDRCFPSGEPACPGCRTLAELPAAANGAAPMGLGDEDAPATSVAWSAPVSSSAAVPPPAVTPRTAPVQIPAGAQPTRAAPAATSRPTAPMPSFAQGAAPIAAPPGTPPAQVPARRAPERAPATVRPAASAAARPAAGSPAPGVSSNRYALTLLDGSARGRRLVVSESEVFLGSSQIKDDPCMSHQHAGFIVRAGRLYVLDRNSVSGVYVSIRGQEAVAAGNLFAAGHRCFHFVGRLEAPAARPGAPVVFGAPVPTSEPLFAVEEMLAGGRSGRSLATASNTISIGSGERTDLCYAGDEGLGVIHCEFSPGIQSGLLRDLSGGLGTYVRLQPGVERRLYPGDRIRVGSQLLRVDQLAEGVSATAPPGRSSAL